jgi:hypothetical protein
MKGNKAGLWFSVEEHARRRIGRRRREWTRRRVEGEGKNRRVDMRNMCGGRLPRTEEESGTTKGKKKWAHRVRSRDVAQLH